MPALESPPEALGPVLILIKHSRPEIIPELPANQWRLSEEGRRRCTTLAEQLAAWKPRRLVSSLEPKAQETAQIVAARLGLTMETWPDLHEHSRPKPGLSSVADFEASVARLFAQPNDLVLGDETAEQARQRFTRAILSLLEGFPAQTLAVVAHGTVITLFAARANAIEPFAFWKSLTLPSLVVFSMPDFSIRNVTTLDEPH